MCYIIVVCIISPMRFFFHLALNQQLFLPFSSPLLKTKTKSSKLAETKVEDNFEEDLELDKQVVDTDKKYLSLLFLLLLCRIIITYILIRLCLNRTEPATGSVWSLSCSLV